MKAFLSYFLIVVFVLTSSVPLNMGNAGAQEEDFEDFFKDKEDDEGKVFQPWNARQKILKEFSDLIEKVQKVSEASPVSTIEYEEYLAYAKNKAESILNAPLFRWTDQNLEFHISEFQDFVVKNFPDFHYIPLNKRIFLDEKSLQTISFSLDEKEIVFLAYDEALTLFKKYQMKLYLNDFKQDRVPWRPYHLRLTQRGKEAFEHFVSQINYHALPDREGKRFEIISKHSLDMKLELDTMGEAQDEVQWKRLLKRMTLNYYLQEWVNLESLWLPDRFPQAQTLRLLPVSCQKQYFTLHPLSVSHLLEESKRMSERALFHNQFFTKLRSDEKLIIPITMTQEMAKKVVESVASWKEQYAFLLRADPGLADKMLQNFTEGYQVLDNKVIRLILTWVLENESPFFWLSLEEEGKEEIIKTHIRNALQITKKIALLFILERSIVDTEPWIDTSLEKKLLDLSEQSVSSQDSSLNEAVAVLYQMYTETQKQVKDLKELLYNSQKRVDLMEKVLLEQSQEIVSQDQKIQDLKEGKIVPPIEDTWENFRRVSLILSVDWIKNQKNKTYSPEVFQELQKIFFHDFPSGVSNFKGAYEAVYHRYQSWLKDRQAPQVIRQEVIEMAQFLKLDDDKPRVLSELLDSQKRIRFEELKKEELLKQFPLLRVEVKQGTSLAPLYIQLQKAESKKSNPEIFTDLVQRAIWVQKAKVEYEFDRFCKANPETEDGLKTLLANALFRDMALAKYPDLKEVNEKTLKAFQEALSHGAFRQWVGYGFLTVISLSLISGPLSTLPRFMGGRFMPAVPRALSILSPLFGTPAGFFALFWMFDDGYQLFFEEQKFVEALEAFNSFGIIGAKTLQPTILDAIQFVEGEKQEKGKQKPHIITDRTELWVARGSYVLFLPIQIAFTRFMWRVVHQFYSQKLVSGIALNNALRDLYIPTRFWTFKPGNEFFTLKPQNLDQAYRSTLDKVLSPEKLTKYIEKWLVVLRRDLSNHEVTWGRGSHWPQTVVAMTRNALKTWVPRHADQLSYFTTRNTLAKQLILERQYLIIRIRLFEEALHQLKTHPRAAISQIPFQSAFANAFKDLDGPAYFGVRSEKLFFNCPPDALTWLLKNIQAHRFWKHWLGGWVGYEGGALGKAVSAMVHYEYLLTQPQMRQTIAVELLSGEPKTQDLMLQLLLEARGF